MNQETTNELEDELYLEYDGKPLPALGCKLSNLGQNCGHIGRRTAAARTPPPARVADVRAAKDVETVHLEDFKTSLADHRRESR